MITAPSLSSSATATPGGGSQSDAVAAAMAAAAAAAAGGGGLDAATLGSLEGLGSLQVGLWEPGFRRSNLNDQLKGVHVHLLVSGQAGAFWITLSLFCRCPHHNPTLPTTQLLPAPALRPCAATTLTSSTTASTIPTTTPTTATTTTTTLTTSTTPQDVSAQLAAAVATIAGLGGAGLGGGSSGGLTDGGAASLCSREWLCDLVHDLNMCDCQWGWMKGVCVGGGGGGGALWAAG